MTGKINLIGDIVSKVSGCKNMPTKLPLGYAQACPVDDILVDIANALCKVVGCGASIRQMAEALPTTPLDDDNVFCPELVLPEVATALIRHANAANSLLEQLDLRLKDNVHGRTE